MAKIEQVLFQFFAGFSKLFVVSLLIWMAGLIYLLFREMFSIESFELSRYLRKVWKLLLHSFEWVAYGSVGIFSIYFLIKQKWDMSSGMILIAGVILSSIYLYIRKQRWLYPPK